MTEQTKHKKSQTRDTLFFLVMGTLLAWSIFITILSTTELDFIPSAALWRIFWVILWLRLIFLNRYTLWVAAAVTAIAGLMLILDTRGTAESLIETITGTARYIAGYEAYLPLYGNTINWALAIGIGLFVFFFGFLFFNFYFLLAASVSTFALVLTSGFFFYEFAFYVFIFCLVAYLIKHLNTHSMKETSETKVRTSPFVLYTMPFTAICLAAALVIPTPEQGAAQTLTDNFITRPFVAVNETIQAAMHPRYFSLAQTGFGGSAGRLGGNVATNDNVIIRVGPLNRIREQTIYLTGAIFDDYTGYSWENSFKEDDYIINFSEIDQNLDYLEKKTFLLSARLAWDFFESIEFLVNHNIENFIVRRPLIVQPDGTFLDMDHFILQTQIAQVKREYILGGIISLRRAQLEIEHQYRSFSVFTPGLMTGITPPEPDINFLKDRGGNILTDNLMRRFARYSINYAEMPSNVFLEMLMQWSYRGVLEDAHEIMLEAVKTSSPEGGFHRAYFNLQIGRDTINYDELLTEFLIPRADWIYENYTILPDTVPERVFDLAESLTDDAKNDYERAMLINAFLRSPRNFAYTLTPGEVPQDRDFVDRFLFDTREGYCTYFASAFVVMMRSLGIPARYVEGFAASGVTDENLWMDVRNSQAHAWAEVYFEGYGWYVFDPTPPTERRALSGGANWWEATHPFRDLEWNEDLLAEMDDLTNREINGAYINGYNGPNGPNGGFGGSGGFGGRNQNNPLTLGRVFFLSVIAVGIIALAIILLRILFALIQTLTLKRKDNNTAAIVYFKKIIRCLAHLDYYPRETDTPLRFAKSISSRMGYVGHTHYNNVNMEDVAHIFYKAKYSPNPVTEKERAIMEEVTISLNERLKRYFGVWRYYLNKYAGVKWRKL
jgi:transglutaminase-like putative cysteine protease